jgi:hypothetical protein
MGSFGYSVFQFQFKGELRSCSSSVTGEVLAAAVREDATA